MLPALLLTAFAFFAAVVVQNPRGNTDTELQGFDFFPDVYLICVVSNFIVVHLDGDAYVANPFPTPSNSSTASVSLASPALGDDEIALTDLAIRSTTGLLVYVAGPVTHDALPPRSALIAGLLALPASGDDEVVCTDLIAYVGAQMVHDALPPRPALIAGLLALPASEDDEVACTDPIVYVGAPEVLPLGPALIAGLLALPAFEDDEVACMDPIVYVGASTVLDALPPRPALIAGLLALPVSEDDGVTCTDPIVYVGPPKVLPPRHAPVAGLIPSPILSVLPDSEDNKVARTDLAIRSPTDLIVCVGTQRVLDMLPPWAAPVAGSLPSTVVPINSSGIVGGELGPATCPALISVPSGSIPSGTPDTNIVKGSNNSIVETFENTLLKELSGASLSLVVGLISFGVVLRGVLGFIIACACYFAKRVAHPVFKLATHYLDRSSSSHSVSIFFPAVIIFVGVSTIYTLFDDTSLVMILDAPAFLLAALLLMIGFGLLALFWDLRISRTLSQRKSLSGPASARFPELLLPGTTYGKGPGESQSWNESPETSVGKTDASSSLQWVVYSVANLFIGLSFVCVLFGDMMFDTKPETPVSLLVVVPLAAVFGILASRTLRQCRPFSGPASERFAEELLPKTTYGKGHEGKQSGLESPEASIGEMDPPSSALKGDDGTPVAPPLPLIEDAGNANTLPDDDSLASVLETPSEDSEVDLSQSAQQEPLRSGAACSGSPLAVSDEGFSSIQSESSSSVADANATTSHVREASGSSTASATPSTGDANEEGPSRKKRKRKRGRRGKGNSGNRIASAQDGESTASTSAAGTSTPVETDEERRRKAAANRFYALRRSQRT